MIRPTGASHAPERFSALRPPLDFGVSEAKSQTPDANASRERDGLFDIVKWNDGERFRDEPVRAPSCFETHRSARRPRKAPALGSRCDAPQHEGEGRPAFWRNEPNGHFGQTNPGRIWPNEAKRGVCLFGSSERPTCGCTK